MVSKQSIVQPGAAHFPIDSSFSTRAGREIRPLVRGYDFHLTKRVTQRWSAPTAMDAAESLLLRCDPRTPGSIGCVLRVVVD